jgi:hypothetical protein
MSEPGIPPGKRRRWVRWLAWLFAILAAVVVAIAIPIRFQRRSFMTEFDQHLAQLHQDIEIDDVERVLGPKATRITPERPLLVLGTGISICVGLPGEFDRRADLDSNYRRGKAGAKLTAVLRDSRGKQYTWTCDQWRGRDASDDRLGLDACLVNECNHEHPPRGERIVAIDLSSDRPLRVRGARWNSNTTLDHIHDPQPDSEAVASDFWRELEGHYRGESAWGTAPVPSRQVSVGRRGAHFPDTDYNSTVSVLYDERGIQLQPVAFAKGMGIVTVPAREVGICGLECSGTLAYRVEMLLPRTGMRLRFFNDKAAADWCWRHRIPFASLRARQAWFDDGTALPPRSTYADQLADEATYYRQAAGSCRWTRYAPETAFVDPRNQPANPK